MSHKELLEILQIIEKSGENTLVQAGHDHVYFGEGIKVSEEDEKRLNDLGCGFDEELNCWIAIL